MFLCPDSDVCVVKVSMAEHKSSCFTFKSAILLVVIIVLSLKGALSAFLMISFACCVLTVVFSLNLGGVISRSLQRRLYSRWFLCQASWADVSPTSSVPILPLHHSQHSLMKPSADGETSKGNSTFSL